MASVEETIRERLGTDETLAGLVGDRIYPDTIPDYDTPRPWIFYTATETAPTAELVGQSGTVGMVEFDCIADTKAGVKAVVAALRAALPDGWRGGKVRAMLWINDQAEDLDGGHLITVRYKFWGTA